MAYNNALIIKRLTERGLLIRNEKWDKLAEKNEQIRLEITSKDHKFPNDPTNDDTLLDDL